MLYLENRKNFKYLWPGLAIFLVFDTGFVQAQDPDSFEIAPAPGVAEEASEQEDRSQNIQDAIGQVPTVIEQIKRTGPGTPTSDFAVPTDAGAFPDLSRIKDQIESLKQMRTSRDIVPSLAGAGRGTQALEPETPSFADSEALVDLYLSGASVDEMIKYVQALLELQEQFPVRVGRVIVFDLDQLFAPALQLKFSEKDKITQAQLTQIYANLPHTKFFTAMNQIGFTPGGVLRARQELKRTRINRSPTWGIKSEGKQYYLSGLWDLKRAFSEDGRLIPPTLKPKGAPVDTGEGSPGAFYEGGGGRQFAIERKNDQLSGMAIVFDFIDEPLLMPKPNPDGSVVYPRFPVCLTDRIRRRKIRHFSPLGNFMNMLFYDESDDTQRSAAADTVGKTVAYPAGRTLSAAERQEYLWASLVSSFGLRCLPTRFKVVQAEGSRYFEFREGNKAWNEQAADENLAGPSPSLGDNKPKVKPSSGFRF